MCGICIIVAVTGYLCKKQHIEALELEDVVAAELVDSGNKGKFLPRHDREIYEGWNKKV